MKELKILQKVFKELYMDQICGIYKITNLKNGKCYIGQSINISHRWKQHTQSLDKIENPDEENPLRRAFVKYGLLKQVSSPGTYGNFRFEVLMECDRDELTENEYAKIDELQPEYNRMMCPPGKDRMWPRKKNSVKGCYVQYHNFDALGYFPYESLYFRNFTEDCSYIISKKRICLNLKGEKLYLIVGIKQKGRKTKDYFLWDYTQIEEIDVEHESCEAAYCLRGSRFLCKKPVYLNELPGFDYFAKHSMGSFAYGLQNVIKDPFSQFLMDERHYVALKDIRKKSVLKWFADFEEDALVPELRLTAKDGRSKARWNFFFKLDVNVAMCTQRAASILVSEPDFFANEFKKFLKENPTVKSYEDWARLNSDVFADLIPNVEHRLHCLDLESIKEKWPRESFKWYLKLLRALSKKRNVVLDPELKLG